MRNAKRLLAALLLAAALIFSSASCGGQTETASEAPAAASSEPQRDYTVQISKDTLRRTGLDITAAAHRLGLTNVTTNDDGSCTVEMTKDERDAVCAALKESLHEQIIALPEDGTWPFIKSVTLSEDGRSAEILSTKDLYKPERDNAAAQAVYIPALLYAAFTGEDAESFTVHFTVKDETTGVRFPRRRADRFRKRCKRHRKHRSLTRHRRISRIQKTEPHRFITHARLRSFYFFACASSPISLCFNSRQTVHSIVM